MPVMFPEITQQPQPIDWTEGGVWDNKRWNEEQPQKGKAQNGLVNAM